MRFDFSHPYLLLLFPLCASFVFWIAKRSPSKRRKDQISHGLRYVLVALTVLSLAGTQVLSPSGEKTAWILLDASASMSSRREEAERLIQAAIASGEEERKIGVIAFGENAMVEIPLSPSPSFQGTSTAVDASGSNLAQALTLAGALLPSDSSGGIAVVSDGKLDAADAAALQSRGIPVHTYTLDDEEIIDVQATKITLPATAYQGQQVPVSITVHSTVEGEATVILSVNRSVCAAREVTLRKGENTFVFQDVVSAPGVATYEAQIVFPGDTVSQNDRAGAYVAVSGAPGVLIVEGQTGAGNELNKMLTASGMTVERISPAMLSESAANLRAYHAVALVNVDADALSENQIAALDAAAKELGVGVAVFGGDSSYALGNYRGSALENMLPVTIDVKNQMELPSAALVLVIDKSGSMTDGQYGVSRLDVAKEAACRAIEVLTAQDQAGVIAFDDSGKWVVPLSYVTDAAQMQEQIGTIRSGGGTAFFTPLAMAYEAVSQAEARHKHIIFLTDGQSADQGYESLAEAMAAEGITLTTVAVGSGADTQILQKLAALGGGRAYAAGQFDNVPKIFTKETMLIAGTYVQNRTFTPVVTDPSLTGFSGFPSLDGYLAVTEKPLATVSLVSDREDPILAWWQYGAGRVLCWTSDVQGAWTQSFLAWEDAAAFFGGLISHILPEKMQAGEMTIEDGKLTYTLENGEEDAQVTAQILLPNGQMKSVTLEQVSPTSYEAEMEIDESGAYAVQIEMKREGDIIASLDGGVVIPFNREYDLRTENTGALEKLSRETGGMAVSDAKELLSFPQTAAQAQKPLRPYLLAGAFILLLLDIAQQRLEWEKNIWPQEKTEKKEKERRRKPNQTVKQKETPTEQENASEQLWQNLQKKKRL